MMNFNDIASKLEKLIYISKKCEGLFLNEENTKAALVLPFLQILGYELILDIEPEYNICSGRVDYFICKGRSSIVVECKRINTNIEANEHIEQLKGYMRELEPTIGILTNGRIYNFYSYKDRKLELEFTFNIAHSNLFDLRRLWDYSKERIELVETSNIIQNNSYSRIVESLIKKGNTYNDIIEELEFRLINDLFANDRLDIKFKSEAVYKNIEALIGIKPTKNNSDSLKRVRKEALESLWDGTVYELMPYINSGTDFKLESKHFSYSIEYSNGLASIKGGTKISDRCTYRGNRILESRIEGCVRNWRLMADIDNILMMDVINIVFGVTDGIIPDNIENFVRQDSYSHEGQYLFGAINRIVCQEKLVIKTIEGLGRIYK